MIESAASGEKKEEGDRDVSHGRDAEKRGGCTTQKF